MKDSLKEMIAQTEGQDGGRVLREWLRCRAREALIEVIEEEVESLCGPKHYPREGSEYFRAGNAPSSVILNGELQEMRRQRVRRKGAESSEEVALRSWKLARDPEEWEEAMMRAILCGVSCRGASQLRESEIRGESKSSLSRLWQRKAIALVEEMQESDLSRVDMLVLMVDAVVLCKDLVATVAMSIDTQGRKMLLGFRVGSSENTEVCSDLLSKLTQRGLRKADDRELLAVIDGSKALKTAILAHYPHAKVQRCLVHKERNLRRYMACRHWKELARLFRKLRTSQGEKDALEAAANLEAFLATKNAQAQDSLEEAGTDLLTLFRLDVPNTLNVSLLSTNAIENAFKNLRRHISRVARWRSETQQADRWVASGLILAQKTFRRIRGHEDLYRLKTALEHSRQARFEGESAQREKAH